MIYLKVFVPFLFFVQLSFVIAGCSDKAEELEKDNTGVEIDNGTSDFYFKGTIDGKLVQYSSGDGYRSIAGFASCNRPVGSDCNHDQGMVLNNPSDTKDFISIEIIDYFSEWLKTCDQIKNMFSTRVYNYGYPPDTNANTGDNNIPGAVIGYVDSDGVIWYTYYGSGVQSGSNFEIVEHIDNTIDNISEKITKMVFNCTLYNLAGESIILKDGELRSRSVNCNL